MEKKLKRNTVLYVRVSANNKKWLEGQAKKFGIKSLSEYMEKFINTVRMKQRARNKRKLR